LVALRPRRELFAVKAPPLGPEVVERDRPRDLAEPGARRAAALVEAVPEPKRALERLPGEVLGEEPVAREPGEVAVHVVEGALGRLGESGHTRDARPVHDLSHNRATFVTLYVVRDDVQSSSACGERAAWRSRPRQGRGCRGRAPRGTRAGAGSSGGRG